MSPSLSTKPAALAPESPKSMLLKGLRKASALSLCAALASQVTAVQGRVVHLGLQSQQEDPCVDPEAVWATVSHRGFLCCV